MDGEEINQDKTTLKLNSTTSQETVVASAALPRDSVTRKFFKVLFLLIALGTFIPPWLFFLAIGGSMENPGPDGSLLLFLTFIIPLSSLIVGVLLGVKKNVLFFMLPHLVTVLWIYFMFNVLV